ncbi:hypothetical protein MAR_001000, partial [Mya arenaria]
MEDNYSTCVGLSNMETLPLDPPLVPPKPQASFRGDTSDNTYNLPDDVEGEEEGDVDQGPDLDTLIDRYLTLTPDSHTPTGDRG